ncbi:hypothetical protein BJY24_004882 [Nocardia transvalensis]|uniref:Uncharacterized protein n=1 Tax=Nocardia transvalensis TaxID=37333 RepID=A0A7W9PHE5_9NOCA|nr:hypothetical protein [Nocardia transvalensis]MBB5915970.1 hypothetical protein [Nocardia transvalensis]
MTFPGITVDLPLHPTVVNALWQARSQAGTQPVDSRDLLVALMRIETSGSWSRISLHCGDSDVLARKVVLDPATGSSTHWEGIRLTDTCAEAVRTAVRLARRYSLQGVPPGMLALGLVADPSTAASQVLHDGLGRRELLDILQSDVLGISLTGLDHELSPATNDIPRPQPPLPPTTAGQALYCLHCGGTPAAAVTIRSHRGFILWMQFVRMPGPFCRDCGLATLRRMTIESVWLGWWGPLSLLINAVTIIANMGAHSRIDQLPPPIPGMPGRPMDPGKPLFHRPGAIGFAIPLGILLWFTVILPLLSP